MGYYIETGSSKGKAAWLKENHGAVPWTGGTAVPEGMVPVVVVDNGPFEAMGILYSREEFDYFNNPSDERPSELMLLPITKAEELCPKVKGRIHWR